MISIKRHKSNVSAFYKTITLTVDRQLSLTEIIKMVTQLITLLNDT